tara:strand:- start:2877 stop:3584 length:708 start_codon:yes stop_codon:yes gene_type:complete
MGNYNKDGKIVVENGVVVICDVDGVLVDFYKLFHDFINNDKEMKEKGISAPEDYIPSYWDYKCLIKEEGLFKKKFDELPNNWPENMDLLEGSKSYVDQVKKLGSRVILLTNIPHYMQHNRIQNLISHGVIFDEAYFSPSTPPVPKHEYLNSLKSRYVDKNGNPVKFVFIDDRTKNITQTVDNFPELDMGFTMDLPFNSDCIKNLTEDQKKKISWESKDHKECFEKMISWIKENSV